MLDRPTVGVVPMRISAHISAPTENAIYRLTQLQASGSPVAGVISSSVSITEVRIDAMIDSLVEAHPHAQSGFGSFMLGRVRSDLHLNWRSRTQALGKGFGVSPGVQQTSQRFDYLVDLRNAIAHGDGGLTAFQIARTSAGIELRRNIEKTFEIVVAGRKLKLNQRAGDIGVSIACEYLLAMDEVYSRVLNALRKDGPQG